MAGDSDRVIGRVGVLRTKGTACKKDDRIRPKSWDEIEKDEI